MFLNSVHVGIRPVTKCALADLGSARRRKLATREPPLERSAPDSDLPSDFLGREVFHRDHVVPYLKPPCQPKNENFGRKQFSPIDSLDGFGDPSTLIMDPAPKILFSRAEAAETLSISVSSLDVLIATGRLKTVHKGRRVLIHVQEIQRLAVKEIPRIWPSRRKTEITPCDSPQLRLLT
jgi:hypothetical protein